MSLATNIQPADPFARLSIDRAIGSEDEDLLEATPYAEELARHIRGVTLGLTIGIYGQWGAGKTSFVELVRRQLKDSVKFVTFSAWPFKTSDEVWRGMMLKIAHDLYAAEENTPIPEPAKASFPERIQKILNRPVFGSAPPEDWNTYDEFLEKLDRTLQSSIRKSSSLSFDDDQALSTIAKAVGAAVSTVSPFGSVFASLFGGEDKAGALLKADNKAARDRIESIADLRELLQTLFDRKAEKKLVCVFVDDLDRCMPDVALDLLEAIQVFLNQVKCVFIVAADQELVGQGLKARYKDVFGSSSSEWFFTRKGREYFEKIIQFGIPVPEPTPLRAHRFLSANFPAWTISSDLITTVLGTNPRRLKQYLALLEYRYAVSSIGLKKPAFAGQQALVDKLVAIGSRSVPAWTAYCTAVESGGDVQAALKELENTTAFSPMVQKLLREPPSFCGVDPSLTEVLPGICALEPDLQELKAKDAVFQRILAKRLDGLPVDADNLMLDDLTELLRFESQPEMIPMIVALAGELRFNMHVESIEREADGYAPRDIAYSPAAQKLRDHVMDPNGPDVNVPGGPPLKVRQNLLLKEPRVSGMDRGVVASLDAILKDRARNRQTGARIRLSRAPGESNFPATPRTLRLRVDAAEMLMARRRFAKGDLLVYGWPELSGYLNYDRNALIDFETQINDAKDISDQRFRSFAADERLARFLRLRPHLSSLYPSELKRIAAAAQSAASATVAPSTPAPVDAGAPAAPPAKPSPIASGEFVVKAVASGKLSNRFDVTVTSADLNQTWWKFDYIPKLGESADDREGQLQPGQLMQEGTTHFNTAFSEDIRSLFTKRAATGAKTRLLLNLDEAGRLSDAPWEAMYVPNNRSFPVKDNDWSIVRFLETAAVAPAPPARPLSVLALVSEAGAKLTDLRRSLEEYIPATQQARLESLFGLFSLDDVKNALSRSKFDVVYIAGISDFKEDLGQGAMLFSHSELVTAAELSATLGNHGISLAVVLGGRTASGGESGIANSIAGRLVLGGIPLAIGTRKNTRIESAVQFTKAFFPALFDSGSVEAALTSSRRAVDRVGLDWSDYVLVSSLSQPETYNFAAKPT